MKQHPIQLDKEQERQCKALAEKWGLPKQRYISRVIARCLERIYHQEIGSGDDNKSSQPTRAPLNSML